jgi:chemotaxis protein methyltransferase CheR
VPDPSWPRRGEPAARARRPASADSDTASLSVAEFEEFRRHVLALTQIDLDQYKRPQLFRRLATLPHLGDVPDLGGYAQRLASEPAELAFFRGWLTINVTEFFRDPPRWIELRDRLLPGLLARRPALRIWSAGCSNGAEPYSLAMLLDDFPGTGPHHILATDIDPAALAVARDGGPYPETQLQNLSPWRLDRFFLQSEDESAWYVRPELHSQVTFHQTDLTRPSPERNFDLIVCRNVIIYLTGAARNDVLRHLTGALRPDGVLFLGGAELVARANPFGLTPSDPCFYRRQAP